jgi:hypothetical protein
VSEPSAPAAGRVLVWLKRDFRLRDHAPLAAAASAHEALAIWVIEPDWLGSAEFDPQHLAWQWRCATLLGRELGPGALERWRGVQTGFAREVVGADLLERGRPGRDQLLDPFRQRPFAGGVRQNRMRKVTNLGVHLLEERFHVLEVTEDGAVSHARVLRYILGRRTQIARANKVEQGGDYPLPRDAAALHPPVQFRGRRAAGAAR